MNVFSVKVLLGFLALSAVSAESSKILGVFPTNWKSHWRVGTTVMKQLAAAGHDVTVVSPFELREPNVRNAILTNFPEDPNQNVFELKDLTALGNFIILPDVLENAINFTLSHRNLQRLMNEKFDLVVVEVFHSEALLGLGQHFKCPVVGVTTFGTSMYTNHMTGNTFLPSHVPNIFLKYTDKMSFWERVHNVITWKLDEALMFFYHYPKQQKLYEMYFPEAEKSFDEQRKSISLILNNNHFSTSTVRPGMPNVIDIGGNHVEAVKPLPEDIKQFLDSADDGAILFSMGSIIQAVQWPIEKREAFVKVFRRLKQKVLWKYENDTLPNKPDNVMISPWIPQRDILAHPNVKLFITHGGLLGTSEALTEGVPLLGIPVFGDQRMNMNSATGKGYALSIELDEISEETLHAKLDLILNDQKFSQRAKEISKIFTDRPMSSEQSVVYWVEYVIRHEGAKHLRSAGLDLSFAELHSLDIYATLIVAVVSVILAVGVTLRCFSRTFLEADIQMSKHKTN